MSNGNHLTPFFVDQRATIAHYSSADWHTLLREAQRANLLSRVAQLLESNGASASLVLPANLQRRLDSAARVSAASARSVRWEVKKIHEALSSQDIPFVLLKGAAYELAGLPPAAGRLYVDVDIMVPKEQLQQAERALFEHGWHGTKMDAYDQKYYRTWMHEIPPMHNLRRNTALDVHHTILPPTAQLKPDVGLLWADAVPLSGWDGVFVLSPADMLLHSAVHLFHDGDLDGGLRDLVDLDALMRHFGCDEEFWDRLASRAQAQDLVRPLFYATRYTRAILGTPVPKCFIARIERLGAPSAFTRFIMDQLVYNAMDPTRRNLDSSRAGLLRWLLYVRSHYLRMPLSLLVPHLLRKAMRSE